jgi:tellurium resistance protein TerD
MSVSLAKGANLSLSKAVQGLESIFCGLGWDASGSPGEEFDLDASAFLLGENDKVRKDRDFIFYNNLISKDGSVRHAGDNRTGEGDGDDEVIAINLKSLPQDISKITVVVTIHDAEKRKQNFGQVSNAFIRIVNQADNKEIARFDLTEDMSTETAMIFGEVFRLDGEWKFKAVGQGHDGGLAEVARAFGVKV